MYKNNSTIIWIFILTSIVIVPTLCLLWFMEQAVSNERLLVQEKLTDIYINKIEDFNWNINQFLEIENDIKNEKELRSLNEIVNWKKWNGLCIISENDLVYPSKKKSTKNDNLNTKLWKVEYEENDYKKAAMLYKNIADTSSSSLEKINALMGSARCFKKLNDKKNAIKIYEEIVYKYGTDEEATQFSFAKIALANLYNENNVEKFDNILIELLLNINYSIPSSVRLFEINSSIEILRKRECGIDCDKAIEILEGLKKFETFSEKLSDTLIEIVNNDKLKKDDIIKIDSTYCKYLHINEKKLVLIFKTEKIVSWVKLLNKKFNDPSVRINLIDEFGNRIYENNFKEKEPIYSYEFVKHSEGNLILEFYLDDSNLFKNGIKNQTTSYVWIGILSIFFILVTVIFAGYFLIQQWNLNKLKNTFLATVTHELKTPISSIRVLIETLKDGKIKDSNKVNEYYNLIAKENIRLGRLVDNFLTFSRMERNKEVLHKTNCNVSEIICSAIESMSVKFKERNCKFSYESLEEDIIIYVNFDAIVTVITNLLDNAYKYSEGDKEILLKLMLSHENLIISVKDNGIGIMKKDISKIFNKFYRVDDKLSRSTEGCGLGLSIVKYILDSHSGIIKVESSEKDGSNFIVSLPINKN